MIHSWLTNCRQVKILIQINFPPYVPIWSKYYYNAQVTEYDTELLKYLSDVRKQLICCLSFLHSKFVFWFLFFLSHTGPTSRRSDKTRWNGGNYTTSWRFLHTGRVRRRNTAELVVRRHQGQGSRYQNKYNRQQLNRNQDAHHQRPTSLPAIIGATTDDEPTGGRRASEQCPCQWGALKALLQEEPVQAPGTATTAAGLPAVWELGGTWPVPHAVPLRPVQTTPTLLQRSMDTEVLSRRWELRVLGFSHRSPGVPRKREKSLGGVTPVLYIGFTRSAVILM